MKKEKEQPDKNLNAEGDESYESERRRGGSRIEAMEAWLNFRYCFRRNMVRQKIEYHPVEEDGQWREIDDTEENTILYELNKANFSKPENLLRVILGSNRILNYNPIDNYFRRDRSHRFGELQRLMDCVVLDRNVQIEIDGLGYRHLFEEYFTKWLKACYICMRGRKFNDVMLILIGAQGRHKTSFLNYLCPPSLKDFMHTGHVEPNLKDYMTASYLVEKIFINVDDQMEQIFGKDYNAMKSIISQDVVTRRLLYKRHSIHQRRIANFCGSVNEAGFLRDSNNRRYLCFAIEDIKTDYSKVDMDSVWAEVAELAEQEETVYMFSQDDYRIIDLMDDNFIAPVEENELLRTTFQPATERDEDAYWMQFSEILKVLKGVGNNSQLKTYNLQTAMRKYGYRKQTVRRPERNMMPLQLYKMKISESATDREMVENLCARYRGNTIEIKSANQAQDNENENLFK